jgi:hypothetical protein
VGLRPAPHAWGRPIIIHDFDRERVDQHRGVPVYAPVMNRLKMLTTFDRAELQAAVINAIFSFTVTSPYDPAGHERCDGYHGQEGDDLWYWKQRKEYREERPLSLQDARILNLFPGEKAEALNSERPNALHDQFAHYALRHMAAQLGTTAEKLTKDWSKVNYSSARAAILDARRTTRRRMGDFCTGTAVPIASAVLEEMMDKGELPLPKRGEVPEFPEARAAYARMRFIGPGQGWIDPTKEAQAALMRMDAGISTGNRRRADQGGDFEENLDQRAREIKMMKRPRHSAAEMGGRRRCVARPARSRTQIDGPASLRASGAADLQRALAITPQKAEMIVAALAQRLGIPAGPRRFGCLPSMATMSPTRSRKDSPPGYTMFGPVAVIPVQGTLVQKLGSLTPYSGMTGYDGLRINLLTAAEGQGGAGIAWDVDSPGGECSAACSTWRHDLCALRRKADVGDPVGERLFGGLCDRELLRPGDVPRTGGTGSIGVICMHVDYSKFLPRKASRSR